MNPLAKLCLLSTLWLFGSCVSSGDGLRAGSVLRSVDNDVFDDSDDQYTSGVSFSYISAHAGSFEDTPLPKRLAGALESRWGFGGEDRRFVIYSLSHRIFTPTDLAARDVVDDDLPYSALLYGTATVGSQSTDVLDAFSLSLGVVGPLALGEEVQSTVHEWIGSEDPQGWDNQLENELLVNLGYDHRRRLVRVGRPRGLGADLLGGLSLSAGNIQTQASASSTLRIGYGVPSNFHMQAPFLAEDSLGLRAYGRPAERRSVYGFAGFAATVLGNAIYLDGNTFTDSHSVDHDHHVLRGSVGIASQLGPLLASIAYERATLPWDHPDGLDEESYLRFGVSWDF